MSSPAIPRKRVDYCIVRHAFYPKDTRERKHALALVEAGYTVDVICLRDQKESPNENVNGVNVYRIPLQHRRGGAIGYLFEYGLSFLMMSCVILYRFLRYRYKVIQVSTMPDFLVFTTLIPRLLGAKILLDLHEPTPELWLTKFGDRKGIFYWLQVQAEQWAIRYAHKNMTVTESLRQRYGERGANISRIAVVSNVCNTDIFSQENLKRIGSQKDESRFTLIMHGLIEDRLGHDNVIDAVVMLRDKIPGICFDVLGQGEYEAQLKKKVELIGCQDLVQFHGYLPFDDMLRKLNDADVGIVAMQRNPYSELIDTNKMYEYIAMKKPVVASRLLGVEATFDETCVKMFEPGNVAELADRILEIYKNPDEAAVLVKNAYARMLERNSWQRAKSTFLGLVRDLASPSN